MSMLTPIYLDGFSTLPLAPEARDAMMSVWDFPGNAGSPHALGERAAGIIESAKASVAELIGAMPAEIFFTSGATEANNLAILGIGTSARHVSNPRRRIVVSAIEHKAVLEPARHLAREGFEIAYAPVDRHGLVDVKQLAGLVDDTTLLVSVMAANNETGVIQPIEQVAELTHARGALFHCDAAQAASKIPIDVVALDVDYLSLSAHKCYGPMGIGALYVAAGAPRPEALVFGGGQQMGVRPGTEPVALIAGFGAAAERACSSLKDGVARCSRSADLLLAQLAARQVRFRRITGVHPVLPGSLAIALEGADADTLCSMLAKTVCVSTGSACNSGQIRISHVLDSMGYSEESARSVLRIFCDRTIGEDDVIRAADAIAGAVARSRLVTGEVLQ